MTNIAKYRSVDSSGKRNIAEERIRKEDVALSEHLTVQSPEQIQRMFHELRVHQIELEIQNEELRLAQAEIESSRMRLADLYDYAPVGYLTESETGIIIEANATVADILGVAKKTLIRLPLSRFIFPADQDVYYLHRKQLFDTHAPQVSEVRMLRPGNPPFWARLQATIFYEGSAQPTCRVILSDITACKLAEQGRQKLKDQLAQMQKMESIERLAGGVANDFNNMLGIILGHAEMALEHAVPGQPFFDNLQEIGKAVDRSAQLTWQLLSFARMQIVATEGLDLNKAVEKQQTSLRHLFGKAIDLELIPGECLWPVAMDISQMEQILTNLCANARDAIRGAGKITIETRNKTLNEGDNVHPDFLPGEYVVLVVSDNGCGIAHDAMSKLFEPFFTTKEMGQGSGLGLAIVHGIVKQNNGFINVISTQGQGTTFEIYLPRPSIIHMSDERCECTGGSPDLGELASEPTEQKMVH
ncbi:MAG: ATP-binding protein [Desulfobulbus sp.]|nr:ATP-binding protein [Desulfobulbus sp.]